MTQQTLSALEAAWLAAAASALRKLQDESPACDVYAMAFWLLYADAESLLCPALAANDESHAFQHTPNGKRLDVRWSPPEWAWSVLDEAVDRVKPLYAGMHPDELFRRSVSDEVLAEDAGLLDAVAG